MPLSSGSPSGSPAPRTPALARLLRLTQDLATDAVTHGDVAAFPPPSALAELPPEEMRRLLDGLLTIRPPRPLRDDVSADLDALLVEESAERTREAGSPSALELPTLAQTHGIGGAMGSRVALWKGDLTTLRAGGIVNAANSAMLGCRQPGHACIDNVIHAVAGPGLRAECAAYMDSRDGRPEETGRALLTGGYHLPAEHVLHTVGPIVQGALTDEHRELLAQCYRSVLSVAGDAGLDSVGLCSVSTGVFGYPKEEAAPLVLATIEAWLAQHPDSDMRIVICAFADVDAAVYDQAIRVLAARRGCGAGSR